jgi:hypothetical protein
MEPDERERARALIEARLEVESLERALATRSSESAPAAELRYLVKRLGRARQRVRSLLGDGTSFGLLLLVSLTA